MKRIINLTLPGAILVACLATLASAQSQSGAQSQSNAPSQSLGDYARTVRKDKPKTTQAKQYDNDNLPRSEKLSVVGNAAEAADNSGAATTSAASPENAQPQAGASTETKTAPASESAKDRQKNFDDWKKRIADQKDKLELATRELDVVQREYKLRAAAFYADAGNRLRNQTGWDKDDAQYKQQIADKQKAVDDAKKQLEDLQEQARKAGVPNSVRE